MGQKNKKKKGKVKTQARQRQVANKSNWLIWVLIVVTAGIFSPSLQNEFVNWDDDRNIYENETVLNLNGENIKQLFTTDVIGNYNPLSNLVLGIQHQLFKGKSYYYSGFHAVNIFLHLLCVFLVFRILLAMKISTSVSLLTAALFAFHPLRVESVTWITEIKDVLYASFFFSSIYAYLLSIKRQNRRWWYISLLLFGVGLFAKIQMVTLPLVLVLLDYWIGHWNFKKSVIRKWPFFLMALAFGLLGVFMLSSKGSLESHTAYSGIERLFVGSYSFCVYLIKSVIPFRMSPLYPYPITLSLWHYLSAIPFVAYFVGLYIAYRRDYKILFFGGAFFLVNIIFLLQILGAGQGYLADRFTYVAYLGLFFIYAHFIKQLFDRPKTKVMTASIAMAMLTTYGYLTFEQTKIWKNSGTLWTHVLKYYDNSTLPFGNRANYYRDIGQVDLALQDYSSSIRLKSDNPAPYNSRAKLYFAKNQDALALKDYIKAIELDPENVEYLVNRGAAYAKLSKWDLALRDLNKGLELDQNNANGYLNRSLVYQTLGRMDLTLSDLQAYLRLKPLHGEIWYEAGRVHHILGDLSSALKSYDRAIELKKDNGLFYLERAKVHFKLNKFGACKQDVQSARKFGKQPDEAFMSALRSQNIQ